MMLPPRAEVFPIPVAL
jgi:hypothetical protein